MTSSTGNIFRVPGPCLMGIHRSPVNAPHKGQWRRALMFYLICAWINGWTNNREAGDSRCECAHYDVIVMLYKHVVFYRHRNSSTVSTMHRGVSNHQPHHCLLNRLFRRKSKKTSTLRFTGLLREIHRCTVNSPHKWPVTRAENLSIWWRHHVYSVSVYRM